MASPTELLALLNFLAPGLADVPDSEKNQAIVIAAGFRPWCFPDEKQDLGQVYYAIWILYDRAAQVIDGSAAGVPEVPAGIKSIKEGDVAITWKDATGGDIYDPSGYYGMWASMNKLCGGGAITASNWRRNGCGC